VWRRPDGDCPLNPKHTCRLVFRPAGDFFEEEEWS
jgi:hypothetical protein